MTKRDRMPKVRFRSLWRRRPAWSYIALFGFSLITIGVVHVVDGDFPGRVIPEIIAGAVITTIGVAGLSRRADRIARKDPYLG